MGEIEENLFLLWVVEKMRNEVYFCLIECIFTMARNPLLLISQCIMDFDSSWVTSSPDYEWQFMMNGRIKCVDAG